jgi:hypothetical protein
MTKKVPGMSTPAYWVVKRTFFKQFCAGEDFPSTLEIVDHLHQTGLSSILDYSVGE